MRDVVFQFPTRLKQGEGLRDLLKLDWLGVFIGVIGLPIFLTACSGFSPPSGTSTVLKCETAPANSSTTVDLVTGKLGGEGSADGVGNQARLSYPWGLAFASNGDLYFSDSLSDTIRKVTASGVVTTIAGKAGVSGSADGSGSAARFSRPGGIVFDSNGNLFVADRFNYTIRKITPLGVVSTFAGSAGVSGTSDGTGASARFKQTFGLTVDGADSLYVSDRESHTIRKISSAGIVTTFAGSPGLAGSTDATGSAARFSSPAGLAVDALGNLLVADTGNHTVRKISPAGVVSTFAGSPGSAGAVDGSLGIARFKFPSDVAADIVSGEIAVVDASNYTIRRISSGGIVSTSAGSPTFSDSVDGTGATARFKSIIGIARNSSGELVVSDSGSYSIRKITVSNVVSTLAGAADHSGRVDGSAGEASLSSSAGMAINPCGELIVSDIYGYVLRKVAVSGSVTTFAGASGQSGSADGAGANGLFGTPVGVTSDRQGNVFVADQISNTIRKITSDGLVSTYAGFAGAPGSADGARQGARFYLPAAVAADKDGTLFISDFGNSTIRKISPEGSVSTVAGLAGNAGSTDGAGSSARFNFPRGIGVDGNHNVYVADFSNHTIRKMTSAGVVTTIAGLAGVPGSADGAGASARFNQPFALAVDDSGTVYVAELGANTIRKIDVNGQVSTVIGAALSRGVKLGALPASLNTPSAIAVSETALYIFSENAILRSPKP